MNLIISTTLLFLLIIGFSGAVSGQDFEETKRLAEQGNATAQYNLGVMYSNGVGVPEDDAEAVRWFRLAAEQGNALAQSNLGLMYANGEGVPQNNLRAYVWFSVAAAQGDEGARSNRDIISETLTPEQLARGQDMATRCFESGSYTEIFTPSEKASIPSFSRSISTRNWTFFEVSNSSALVDSIRLQTPVLFL